RGQHRESRIERLGYPGTGDTRHREHRRAVPGGAVQCGALDARGIGFNRVDLVERDDLDLTGQAVTVSCQLLTDCVIGADDIVEGAIDEVEDHRAAFDMAKKASADPRTLAGSLDQTGKVG